MLVDSSLYIHTPTIQSWLTAVSQATNTTQSSPPGGPHSLVTTLSLPPLALRFRHRLLCAYAGMGDSMSVPGLWAVVAAMAIAVIDALVRRAHRWAWEASLGASRRAHLPPGDMGWPVVGAMWKFLWAFKSGNPDSFIGSFIRRLAAAFSRYHRRLIILSLGSSL
jgi:hypothetical protein